jgi:hypothetical protein
VYKGEDTTVDFVFVLVVMRAMMVIVLMLVLIVSILTVVASVVVLLPADRRTKIEIPVYTKRIFLDYTYGIGKIYTAEVIDKAKQSPSFERELRIFVF